MSCSPPSVKKPCYDRSSLPKAPVTRRLLNQKFLFALALEEFTDSLLIYRGFPGVIVNGNLESSSSEEIINGQTDPSIAKQLGVTNQTIIEILLVVVCFFAVLQQIDFLFPIRFFIPSDFQWLAMHVSCPIMVINITKRRERRLKRQKEESRFCGYMQIIFIAHVETSTAAGATTQIFHFM